MAYTGQHYTKAALVDDDGIDTGYWNPTTINWLSELVESEGERLVTGLFGASEWPARFHVVTSQDWPYTGAQDAALTPALIWRFVTRSWSPVLNPNLDHIVKQYTGLGGVTKTFTVRWPKLTDVVVELTIQERDKYPPLDLELKLENLLSIRETDICLEKVQMRIDDPVTARWTPSQSGVTVSQMRVEYRYLPIVWYGDADLTWGAIINEITGYWYDKKIKDDLDIDAEIDEPFVVTG